jgi:hypothetical protein
MSKLLIPNTCQIPNVLLDKVMPRNGDASLRVLLAITRLTYGFGDPEPRKISYTRLETATGLSRQGVANGLNGPGDLINIKRGPKNERIENEYALNLDVATGQLINEIDQTTNLTRQRRVNGLFNEVDSLKPNESKPNTSPDSDKQNPCELNIGQLKTPKCSASQCAPGVKAVIGTFHDLYFGKFGAKPDIVGGHDPKIISELIKSHGFNEVEGLLRLFFDHPPASVEKNNKFTLPMFKFVYNELLAQNRKDTAKMRAFG